MQLSDYNCVREKRVHHREVFSADAEAASKGVSAALGVSAYAGFMAASIQFNTDALNQRSYQTFRTDNLYSVELLSVQQSLKLREGLHLQRHLSTEIREYIETNSDNPKRIVEEMGGLYAKSISMVGMVRETFLKEVTEEAMAQNMNVGVSAGASCAAKVSM